MFCVLCSVLRVLCSGFCVLCFVFCVPCFVFWVLGSVLHVLFLFCFGRLLSKTKMIQRCLYMVYILYGFTNAS